MPKHTWKDLDIKEKRRIVSLYKQGDDLKEVAEANGWAVNSLARQVRGFIYYEKTFKAEISASFVPTEMSARTYDDYTEIEDGNAVVISDLEIPDCDPQMLELAFLTGLKHNIRRLIIAGDFLATDQQGLNDWVSVWKEDSEISYGNALGMSLGLIEQFSKYYDHIDMISGNHDERVARKTQGEIHLGMLLRTTPVKYSQYRYLWLKNQRGYTYVCHPQNYSANSIGLGQRLYNKTVAPDGSKPHVVLGHTHLPGWGQSPDGLREVVSLGTMRDPMRTKYKTTMTNTHFEWGQGFLLIKRGFFRPMVRKHVDWQEELGDLCPVFARA